MKRPAHAAIARMSIADLGATTEHRQPARAEHAPTVQWALGWWGPCRWRLSGKRPAPSKQDSYPVALNGEPMILSNLPEALNLQGSEAHRVHFAQRDFLLAYH